MGYRLVLVLAPVRRAAPAHPAALAAPGPALGRVPGAGRPGPQARPVRGPERGPPRAPARGRHPGRGDPGRAGCRVPAVVRGGRGDEPGLDVPAAAAGGPDLPAGPPGA